jgi:hypothetical protein
MVHSISLYLSGLPRVLPNKRLLLSAGGQLACYRSLLLNRLQRQLVRQVAWIRILRATRWQTLTLA